MPGAFIQQSQVGGGGGGLAPVQFMGDYNTELAYAANQLVAYDGAIWRATGALGAGTEPAEGAVLTRTAHAYAFGQYNPPNCPILENDVLFEGFPGGTPFGVWIVGSSGVSIDAEPGSDIHIENTGGPFVLFIDTGAPGAGNVEFDGHAQHNPGAWDFVMPASGRLTVECAPGMTAIKASGPGMPALPARWEKIAEAQGGGGDLTFVQAWDNATVYDANAVVTYGGKIYYTEDGAAAGAEPGRAVGPPDYRHLGRAGSVPTQELTAAYQQFTLAAADPTGFDVSPFAAKTGPAKILSFKLKTGGTVAVRTTPAPAGGWDAYGYLYGPDPLDKWNGQPIQLSADDSSAGDNFPLNTKAGAVAGIYYFFFQQYNPGTAPGGLPKDFNARVELSAGATLDPFPVSSPWKVLGADGSLYAAANVGEDPVTVGALWTPELPT